MAKNNLIYVNPDEAPWITYNQDIVAILAKVDQSSHVVWIDAFEGLRFPKDSEIDKVHEIVKLLGDRDIMLTIICSIDKLTVDKHWSEMSQFAKIVYWPEYFLYDSAMRFTARSLVPECPDFPYDDVEMGFTYPFIVYNGKPRPHRCQLMDNLAEQDMLSNNVYTWNKSSGYEFENFDDATTPMPLEKPDIDNPPKWLTDFKNHHLGTATKFHPNLIDDTVWYSYQVHPIYSQAFCQVITETTLDHPWITEKTIEPILAQKPFLILGAPGIHQKLVDMGFYLYDDIFDYSFDSEPDTQKRIDAIMDNLKTLQDKNLNDVYRKISHVAWNNANKFLQIVREQRNVPKDIYTYQVDHYIRLVAHSSEKVKEHEYFQALYQQYI